MSLFLILTAVCFSGVKHPEGLRVDIAVPLNQGLCGDGGVRLLVQVFANGRMQLNGEELELRQFRRRLEEIFQNRSERLIFIISDEDVTFGQVAAVVDAATLNVDRIALLSHLVQQNQGDCGPALPAQTPLRSPVPGSDSVHFWRWF